MSYYAQIDENNIVIRVIVADEAVIQALEGNWTETFLDDLTKRYASVGDGWDGKFFIPKPFDTSTWDAINTIWVTPAKLGVVGNASPIITADGVDFVTVYLIGEVNSSQGVLLNGELLVVLVDGNGYGEFELATDTPGLIVVEWGGFSLEVAAL